jgi:hypothetical protein
MQQMIRQLKNSDLVVRQNIGTIDLHWICATNAQKLAFGNSGQVNKTKAWIAVEPCP